MRSAEFQAPDVFFADVPEKFAICLAWCRFPLRGPSGWYSLLSGSYYALSRCRRSSAKCSSIAFTLRHAPGPPLRIKGARSFWRCMGNRGYRISRPVGCFLYSFLAQSSDAHGLLLVIRPDIIHSKSFVYSYLPFLKKRYGCRRLYRGVTVRGPAWLVKCSSRPPRLWGVFGSHKGYFLL